MISDVNVAAKKKKREGKQIFLNSFFFQISRQEMLSIAHNYVLLNLF